MGRKRIYHTEEEKIEAKRRHRMDWYDRHRKQILKAYKIRKSEQASVSGSIKPKSTNVIGVAQPRKSTDASSSTHKEKSMDQQSEDSLLNRSDTAPQILLGRVHRQSRMLRAFMQADAEQFCLRVANEVLAANDSASSVKIVQTYMDSVASRIDGARPHTAALFNQYGAISEWKEAKQVQNSMALVMQYLDEIYHQAELDGLDGALALGLLSFQG